MRRRGSEIEWRECDPISSSQSVKGKRRHKLTSQEVDMLMGDQSELTYADIVEGFTKWKKKLKK